MCVLIGSYDISVMLGGLLGSFFCGCGGCCVEGCVVEVGVCVVGFSVV
jgi:hypothetical protein